MYDRNGLELTPKANTMNSYKYTAVDLTAKKFTAYARATQKHSKEWNIFRIGNFKDPRDAAYIGQKFADEHTKEYVRTLHTDGEWAEYAALWISEQDIPEWKYEAEGMTIDDITGENTYKINRVDDAKEALREWISMKGIKVPPLNMVNNLIQSVNQLYQNGKSYRQAVRELLPA